MTDSVQEYDRGTVFDPSQSRDVETLDQIRRLAVDTESLLVRRLTDEKLAAITARAPRLRHLIADGVNDVTDAGLSVLAELPHLESLDLEWSRVTDDGLVFIAAAASLRWVDLGFCPGVSPTGVADLRRLRPDLEIVDTT